MNSNLRPDDLEEPRYDVDLDVEHLEITDHRKLLAVRLVRESEQYSLDVEKLDQSRQFLRRP